MILFRTNPILIAAAVIPAVALLVYVYRADRLEPESPLLLASLVLYGILATAIAMVFEKVLGFVLGLFVSERRVLYYAILFFVIVGPAEPIAYSNDVPAVFTAINEQQLPFVSRGDDSGTDKKEKKIWTALEIDTSTNPNYIESGQGMGATISMANEKGAYCLTDRGTWLKLSTDSENEYTIGIVCEGGKELLNQYGVIAVNPEKYPEVNNEAANAFIEWITSEKVQGLIAEYGVDKYGQALFVPNAGTDN